MLRRLGGSVLVLGLGGLCASPAAAGLPPGGVGCDKIAIVTSTSEGQTTTSITSLPARVCSVSFVASGANGWAEVFDSPDTTDPTHAQATRLSEPGAATAGNSASEFFGDIGRYAYYGVGARVYKGRLTVQYQ